jgi:hypothetical protein
MTTMITTTINEDTIAAVTAAESWGVEFVEMVVDNVKFPKPSWYDNVLSVTVTWDLLNIKQHVLNKRLSL